MMNRKGFLKAFAALPLVGPALAKLEIVPEPEEILDPVTATEHHEAYTYFTSHGVVDIDYDVAAKGGKEAFEKHLEARRRIMWENFRLEMYRIIRGSH